MQEFEQMRVFVAVADEGGFAAAARRLGVSPPAITRAVGALERRLGVRLLVRTTRSVRRTEAGERFLVDCRRILGELEQAEASARGAHREPQGELAVSAPVTFGRLHIAPLLLDFLQAHPKVQARLLLVDRLVHLIDEGFDVALRIAQMPDSSYTALPVGRVQRMIVASPEYLARHGTPATPEDLPRHQAIGFAQGGGEVRRWTFRGPDGHPLRDAPQPAMRLLLNSVDVGVAAALAGHGMASLLSYQVREHLAAGRLQRVMQSWEMPPVPVQLVYAEGRLASAKVRAFVDFAAARLRQEPALAEH